MPRVLLLDRAAPDPAILAEAAAVLARGGLVAFPTETVYGLGARGLHADEVAKIFVAKGRPPGHPVILHVDGIAMARSLAAAWSAAADALATAFWPGPLTLVVPRGERVPPEVSGGSPTVGIRMPADAIARELIRIVGEPLAAPSANAHLHVSPTTAEHVVRSLGDRVDLVLDGGPCIHGIESTVLAVEHRLVLRPGAVSLEALRRVLPDVADGTAVLTGDDVRASPGMAAKHYAPRKDVILVPRASFRAIHDRLASERRVLAIVAAARVPGAIVLPDSPDGYAHGLFAALHEADAAEADLIVIEDVPREDPEWWAVADRLARASRR